jgi:RNA polymerase sigma-70 factor, ECF subfamily
VKVLANPMTNLTGPVTIEALVEAYYDDVWKFCARRAGLDLASDLTQESFLTAQKALVKFEGRSSVKTWLFGIALMHCRESSRKYSREILGGPMILADAVAESPPVHDRVTLEAAIADLSEEHREVVVLHELEGFTYEEIAGIAGIPVGTVKSRLHHAFAHLRKKLEAQEVTW